MARTTALQADDSKSFENERRMWTDGNFIESIQSETPSNIETQALLFKIFYLVYL